MNISVPIKKFNDDDYWLLLYHALGRRIILRADVINKCKKRPTDFDGHECDEATAISSVKCKGRNILINDKINKR